MIISKESIKRIDDLINRYIILEIKREFLHEEEQYDINELIFLLENALILSNSYSNKNKERALAIATIVAESKIENNQLKAIASLILGNLRNFQGQKLIDTSYNEIKVDPLDILKNNIYKFNNTVELVNREYVLNDFQLKFYELVKQNKITSISAPTSAGKSFIVKRIILDLLLRELDCCVYIVPTRALISEVVNEFRMEISKEELNIQINIVSSSDITNLNNNLKTILVLTQERFYQLCNNNEIKVDMLIVDEAQNVMDGKRGVLLEYSIKYAKKLWKDLRVIFISPLIDNPEEFNNKFSNSSKSSSFNEMKSSVRQNVIKLYKDTHGYKVTVNGSLVESKVRINRSASSIAGNIANVVQKFNNGENSIVYCNTTRLAVDVCEKLFNSGEYEDLENIDELNEFADFIEYSISKKYLLSKYIRKGIVYHYGKLPPFIRGGIEELAARGYFKVIACTSTLLQGINLPAQNIYIYNPTKGQGENKKELSNLEFWNLAGRAGRMGNDFCGNIILIQSNYWSNIDIYDNKRNEVEFITDRYKQIDKLKDLLINSGDLKKKCELSEDETNDIDDVDCVYDNDDIDDYIVSSTLIDRINNEQLISGEIKKEDYDELENIVNEILNDFKPPQRLLIRLVGMRYSNIDRLWRYFKDNDNNIEAFILSHPFNESRQAFLSQYGDIIDIINEYLMNESLYNEYTREKLKYMSYSWIMEDKLKNILLYKINRDKSGKDYTNKEVSKKIEEQVKYLNGDIRYKLVKGFYAFGEILKEYLVLSGKESLVDKVINMPMYLEIGACKGATVELISLGINREFAIELVNNYKLTEKNIVEQIKKLDLSKLKNKYLISKLDEFIKTFS